MPGSGVTLHTENGMLGMGPAAVGDQVDIDLTNAGKVPETELDGASYFHHADRFMPPCRTPSTGSEHYPRPRQYCLVD